MTQDEIIEMAEQAGFVEYELDDGTINAFDKRYEAFAKLVAAKAIAGLESQEPVEWVDLQKEAQQIVESKILWKRFIDGTPLANDIACWMADFALQHTNPPQRTWVGLTDEEVVQCQQGNIYHFYRCIEAKLKEKNT
jgi:hypothetical protein